MLSKDGIDTLGEAFVRDFNPDTMAEPMPLDLDQFVCDDLGMVQDFARLSKQAAFRYPKIPSSYSPDEANLI